MEEMTKGFTVYPDYWKAIEYLPIEEQKNICLALVKYGILKELPKVEETSIAFAMISAWKRALDNSIENHEKAQERGTKGGRPSKHDYSELTRMRRDGKTVEECANYYGVSVDTIYKRKEWKDGKKVAEGGGFIF